MSVSKFVMIISFIVCAYSLLSGSFIVAGGCFSVFMLHLLVIDFYDSIVKVLREKKK